MEVEDHLCQVLPGNSLVKVGHTYIDDGERMYLDR